jgi:hypothetical protein
MEDTNASIFAQAKIEYTKQLVDVLYPNLFIGMKTIYEESKKRFIQQKKEPLVDVFRDVLQEVPKWNSDFLEKEYNTIVLHMYIS